MSARGPLDNNKIEDLIANLENRAKDASAAPAPETKPEAPPAAAAAPTEEPPFTPPPAPASQPTPFTPLPAAAAPAEQPPFTPPAAAPAEEPPFTPPAAAPAEEPPFTPPAAAPVEEPPFTPPAAAPVEEPPFTPPPAAAPVQQQPAPVEPTAPVEQSPFTPPASAAPVEEPPFTPPPAAAAPPPAAAPVEEPPFTPPPATAAPPPAAAPVEEASFATPPTAPTPAPAEQPPFTPPPAPADSMGLPPAQEAPAAQQPYPTPPPLPRLPGDPEPETAPPPPAEFAPSAPAPITPARAPAQAGVSGSLAEVGEPQDILLAIAIVDPDAEQAHDAQETVNAMRAEVAEHAPAPLKKGAFPAKALPFNQLDAGDPPVATIYSPKGGVGKSSTAMNLAMYIAAIAQAMAAKDQKRAKGPVKIPRVLLLDGDIAHGCLGLRMTGKMDPSIGDLYDYIYDRREQGFSGETAWPQSYDKPIPSEKGMLDFVTWPPDLPNLNLLSSPKDPDDFYAFGPREYNEIIRMLKTFYDVIIIDAGTDVVQDSQRAWIQHAHQVFMVTTPEIDSLYNAARTARYMAKPRPHPRDDRDSPEVLAPLIGGDDLSLVITKADVDSGLPLDKLIKVKLFPWMRKDQIFRVPDFHNDMMRMNNRSDFLVRHNAEYAKVVSEMARYLFEQTLASKRQRQLPQAPPAPAAAVE